MRENDFLEWIRSNTPAHPAVPLHVGDDMAAVTLPGGGAAGEACRGAVALLKIDQCLDTVHFDLRRHTARQAATKAVNRCLSDCAGMACLPAAIMISVALPKQLPNGGEAGEDFAQELFLAARAAAEKFDCPLVGGDTASWNHPLAITVAALGRVGAAPPTRRYVTRGGGKAGDTLFVSGRLGGSLLPDLGGRHLTFTPRIELAQALLKALGDDLHAMMDLSDGLAQDLPRLCKASEVGAQVLTNQLPIHGDAELASAKDHIPAGLHALADGEDYELLFAVKTDAVPELISLSTDEVPLTAIGVLTKEKKLQLVDQAGLAHAWPKAGWEHGVSN